MFTGIIEEIGTIKKISSSPHGFELTIGGNVIFSDLKIGDSVAVNGVCLTAKRIAGNTFVADAMPETINYTSLSSLKIGSLVNLERAMAVNGRFGGHIVSGHIDGTGTVSEIKSDGNAVRIRVSAGENLLKYIIKKGSITIDGISLTVTDVDSASFGVSVIPHTSSETTLTVKKVGDKVNLENDVLAKYVEKLCTPQVDSAPGKANADSNITLDFLQSNGF